MLYVIVKHFQYVSLFLASKSLYYKPVITREEEERARLANAFSCLEHPISIRLQSQRFYDIIWAYVVHSHDLCKFLLFMTYNLRLYTHLKLVAIHQILLFLLQIYLKRYIRFCNFSHDLNISWTCWLGCSFTSLFRFLN